LGAAFFGAAFLTGLAAGLALAFAFGLAGAAFFVGAFFFGLAAAAFFAAVFFLEGRFVAMKNPFEFVFGLAYSEM
jgi:hypothetical protein